MNVLTIVAVNSLGGMRYNISHPGLIGTLHVMNEKSLKWNLKKVFKLDATAVRSIMSYLEQEPTLHLDLDQTAAA